MRRFPSAIAAAAAAHACVLAAVLALVDGASKEPRRRSAPTVAIEIVTPPPIPRTSEPVEVDLVLVDVPDVPAPVEKPVKPTSRPRTASRASVASPSSTASTASVATAPMVSPSGVGPGTPDGSTAPARSPWLDMRKGHDPRGLGRNPLGLSGRMEQADPVDPLLDPSVKPTGKLAPSGGGRYRAEDGPYVARIERDGSVALTDKRNLQHQFTSMKNVKKVLREAGPFGLLRVDFDIYDAVMRGQGMDPYSSRKLAFLDATRDERVQIGAKHRAEQLARTGELVQGNLDRLWATIADPGARKQALFELWDEAIESGDERRLAAGQRARLAVLGFIRARLPAGSAGAYTTDEIAAFNAKRQSKQAFVPYERLVDVR